MDRQQLIDFIDQHGFGVFLTTETATDMFPSIPSGLGDLLGLQMVGEAESIVGRNMTVVAFEAQPDHALLSDVKSKSNEVPKIGFADKQIGFIRMNEHISFTAEELEFILEAQSLPSSDPKVIAAAQLILANIQQLKARKERLLERQFWQSCLGEVNLPTKDGTAFKYFTGIDDLGSAATAWDDKANATPYADLNKMLDAFEDQGFDVDAIVMSRATMRTFVATDEVQNTVDEGEKRRFARGEYILDHNGRELKVYNEAWLAKNLSGGAGRLQYLPDGEIVGFARSQGIVKNIGLFAKPNLDPTHDFKQPTFQFGDYVEVTTTRNPVAITYRHSFEGGIGIVNAQSVKKMTVYTP